MSEKDLDSIWLKLKFYGGNQIKTELHFRFRHVLWHEFRDDNRWRRFDVMVFKSDKKIYELFNDESMEDWELNYLEKIIDKALNGTLNNSIRFEPMEPILDFWVGIENKKPCLMITSSERSSMPSPLAKGYFKLFFNERNMRKISLYLKLKRGAVSLEDEKVCEMFKCGVFYRKKILGRNQKIHEHRKIEKALEISYNDDTERNFERLLKKFAKSLKANEEFIVPPEKSAEIKIPRSEGIILPIFTSGDHFFESNFFCSRAEIEDYGAVTRMKLRKIFKCLFESNSPDSAIAVNPDGPYDCWAPLHPYFLWINKDIAKKILSFAGIEEEELC